MLSSLANGLRVLEYLVDHGEQGVSETARGLGLTVGTTHRMIATLVEAGYLEQNGSNRRYRPSAKFAELARSVRGDVDFISAAHHHLEQLKTSSGETVNLGVLRDDAVVYIDRAVTDQPLAVAVKIGSRVPAYCTSLGKAILAFGPVTDRDRYLMRLKEIAAGDPQVAPSKKELAQMLDDIKTQGFAEDDGEYYPDIACFAAPLLDRSDQAIAAVSVSGPRHRIRERRDDLVPLVQMKAKELTDLFNSVSDARI